MSGLVKAKDYDWKDSNIALLGSDQDKKVKKSSALTEPAWQGCELHNATFTQVWRIEKFEVKDWPKESYGKFFSGDSYITLHGQKDPESNEIDYDVHFWIGKESTQDEYGTAAYKTVELDTFLDDAAVQHREVEGKESEEFKKYFPKFEIEKGGIDSGFNIVERGDAPLNFENSVIHFRKTAAGEYQEIHVPFAKDNFRQDDGFVVILFRDSIIEVRGQNVKKVDGFRIAKSMTELKGRYPKANREIVDSQESLRNMKPTRVNMPTDKKVQVKDKRNMEKIFPLVATGSDIDESQLDSSDVFLLETQTRFFVWIGKRPIRMKRKMLSLMPLQEPARDKRGQRAQRGQQGKGGDCRM
ncbi:hypothetical protein OS493_030573 [Desmophyllum pertusum]|uniref:Gelsolin-like domain-containing protein n=1 Tax=Desmophyllum pertusum TaxID=174260 RepID=A0A9W9Y8N2_9CNID|nr:hypothetical protein OS493_030573 [Desmophyllum pertusum]